MSQFAKDQSGGGHRYPPTREEVETLDRNFVYHPPAPDQVEVYHWVRLRGKQFAEHVLRNCPPSRERSLSITKIEEAVFWANAAIARNE